jgi:hypothetical protein
MPILVPTGSAAAPSPVAHWRGDGNANDGAGGRHGTATAGVSYGPGVVNQAFVLNGSNGAIDVPDGPITAGARNFSIVAWVNAAASGAGTDPKIYCAGTSIGEFHLAWGSNNLAYFGPHLTNSAWILPVAPCPLSVGIWVFLSGVRRDREVELWINGALWARMAAPDLDLLQATSTTSVIGAYRSVFSGYSSYFAGSIDELRVYDVALTGDQIAKLYADERP